jgi:asparagine synthetase B (glutamine-hydrolysing)
MGDFLLDFRHRSRRRAQAEALRFFPDMAVDRIARERFALFVSRAGTDRLWAPFESRDGFVVALAGRVALTASQWDLGAAVEEPGGLACRAIYRLYRERGIEGLTGLGGGFAIHLYDPQEDVYHLVNDGAGAFPCYRAAQSDDLICSHPDVLAELLGGTGQPPVDSPDGWDLTSMAQFIATGEVTFPHSYYRQVVALDFGCVHRFELPGSSGAQRSTFRYARWQSEHLSGDTEEVIAEHLADAIVSASRSRTLPILGRTAVALSGGLDSRSILCAADRNEELFSFCAFDEQTAEFRCARAIADSLGVKLLPFERSFDHYGANAEMGVKISGGMGEIGGNHFLGFRDRLRQLGVENFVTGCYFDYLFKSLALDSREAGLLRRERFRDFSYQTYLPHFAVAPGFAAEVRERLDALFPEADRSATDPGARARNAMRRIFPLWHEGDNAQRLIPQRVMGWYTPALDPALLELCRSIPPALKLDKRVFRKAVRRVCGDAVSRIPDNNTGLPLDASAFRVGIYRYWIALRRRLERRRSRMATEESWPNWPHYIRTSATIRALWQRPNPVARELLGRICGQPFREDVATYCDRPTDYFMRLLTLKIWLDHRSAREWPR